MIKGDEKEENQEVPENNNDMKDSFSAVNLPNCTRKI